MGQKLSEQALQNKKSYNREYARKNFRCKNVQFNVQYKEDIELLEWVQSRPEGGNTYIKGLIRDDMNRVKSLESTDGL